MFVTGEIFSANLLEGLEIKKFKALLRLFSQLALPARGDLNKDTTMAT